VVGIVCASTTAQYFKSFANLLHPDPAHVWSEHFTLAETHYREGRYDLAQAALEECTKLAEKSKLTEQLVESLLLLADLHLLQDHGERTNFYIQRARNLVAGEDPRAGLIVARDAFRQGHFEEARSLLEKVRPLFMLRGNWRTLAKAYALSAQLALVQGDMEHGLQFCERAWQLFDQEPNPHVAIYGKVGVLLTRSAIHRERGQLRLAGTCLAELRGLMLQQANPRGEAISLEALGDLALERDSPSEALDFYQRAEEKFRSLNGTLGIAISQWGQAESLRRLGEPEQAMSLLDQSVEEFERHGHVVGVGLVHWTRGRIYVARNQCDDAILELRTATDIFENAHIPVLRAEVGSALAVAFARSGHHLEALKTIEGSERTLRERQAFKKLADVLEAKELVLRPVDRATAEEARIQIKLLHTMID
jgi:tetratricopeptide (TPR) repeat protein